MGSLFKTSNTNLGVSLDQDDFEILKNRVYEEFGYPSVKVEITDSQFITIIHSAVEYINTYSPKSIEIKKLIYPSQTDYTFEELDRDMTAILDAYYSMDYHIMQGAPPEILFPDISVIKASNDATILSDYIVKAGQHSLAKTIFGCTPSQTLIGPRTIRINPKPIMETIIVLKVSTAHDENLGSLDEYERNWLIKFCIAKTAKILGRIRTKFTGVTLPLGDLNSDGASLITESIESEKELIAEIKSRRKFAESFILVG